MGCLRIKYDDGILAPKNWKVFVGGVEKSEAYRYDYQGQFAEKDGETGLHHFELRQWDARIARWNSTDPYGQYFSPYMGMGNNPLSLVDPNGGFTNPPPGGSIFMDEITLTASGGGTPFSGLSSITLSSLTYDFEVPDIVYDYQQNQVHDFVNSSGGDLVLNSTNTFVYDGEFKIFPLIHDMKAGQHVRVEVKNMNILGVQLGLQDKTFYTYEDGLLGSKKVYTGDSYTFGLLPGKTKKIDFYRFDHTPMNWRFELGTTISDAALVRVRFYSGNTSGQNGLNFD